METQRIPIACDMNALDDSQRARYQNLRKNLLTTVCEIKEESDGYSFCWNHDASILMQIAEWVSLERLCCPFLQFSIKVTPAEGPIWLRLGEGADIKDFLQHEFGRP
jgi:hypothetical protein